MFSIKSAHTGEGRYPGDHPQPSAGPSLDPGLRRGERLRCGASTISAHDLRRPVSRRSSQTSAGPSLDPGLRREERLKCGVSITSAHTGGGRYPGDHPNHLRARHWTPASAGASGLDVVPQQYPRMTCEGRGERRKGAQFQLHPLIPAKAGIQEIIPNLSGPVTGSRPTPG